MKSNALAATAALFAALLVAAACTKSGPNNATTAAAEQHYQLNGEVVSVDVARKVMVVQHEEVKGYMPAMTMEFSVSAADAAAAKPGERIRADLVPVKDGNPRLEKIWPDDRAAASIVDGTAKELRQDTHTRGKGAYRDIGEAIPDFALYDQEGKVVQSGRFHGKMVMVNFIYSRCPFANMCPAATMKMMSVQKLAREAGVKNLDLVSITLDPTYDTPAVLKEYAAQRSIDTSNFSFLTGPEGAVRDLLTQFGVVAEFEDNIIKHSLATLLIDENGKIIYRADGSTWEPKDFVAHMGKKG